MDFFDDDDDEPPTAPPVFKFQPKSKPKPKARAAPSKKESSASKPLAPQQDADISQVATPTKANVPSDDISDSAVTSNVGANVPSMEENATSKDCGNQCDNMVEPMVEASSASKPSAPQQAADISQVAPPTKANVPSDDISDSAVTSKKKPVGGKVSVESASDPKETFVVPSETQNMNPGSADGGPDFSVVTAGDALSIETECMLNHDGTFETSPDLPPYTNADTDCLLNQASQFAQSPSGFAAEASDQVNVNEAENNNVHNEEERQPKKRKSSSSSNKDADGTRKSARKRKKTINANEETTEHNEETPEALEKNNEDAVEIRKTPQKRKKTKQALEKSNEETTEPSENPNKPPKKFPRGTRRRNRCVDKTLLETPEDEIDYQSLPIKDLIMLAEHRERQLALEKKKDTSQPTMPAEEATAPPEPVKKTTDNVWGDDDDDEYDDDMAAQGGGSFDGPSSSAVERDTSYFNYHSHMNRTPRIKWTKQDTVLFYEGVRQFGSDLSMIQHLFPGRTRQQIKLKYKKEERQKPMELLDALANRAKDLTHYKFVIGRLQEKIDREEEQMHDEGGSLGAGENEGPEEGTADDTQEQAQDEADKSEQNCDGAGAVEDPVKGRVGSPAESAGSDSDTGGWGEYESTF